jgi:alkylation response protein AidB-like acyl-CoA dehydrogenase
MYQPDFADRALGRLQNLAPLIALHRHELDAARRLPQPIFEGLADAGLLRLWLPRALGEPQLAPDELLTVVAAAAELDASVGWIVGVAAGSNLAAGHLPEAVTRRLFEPRRTFCAHVINPSGTAKKVGGGYRVSGNWSYASGIHHASTVMVNCAVADSAGDVSDPSKFLSCMLPRDQVTIQDDWHVSGLRGTGSCSFHAHEVFVPADHVISAYQSKQTQAGLLYSMPKLSLLSLVVAAVPIGIAEGALDDACVLAVTKTRTGDAQVLRDRDIAQAEFGRAKTLLTMSREFLKQALHALSLAVGGPAEQLTEARITFKLACVHACENAVSVVDRMAAAIGAEAILDTSPIERRVRDVHAVAKHIAVSPNNFVLGGRHMLGVALGTDRF